MKWKPLKMLLAVHTNEARCQAYVKDPFKFQRGNLARFLGAIM